MSWRERIAAIIARGGRGDLTTPAYHGTMNTFPAFENIPVGQSWMIDRALGTHVAKDPALASSFADRWIKPGQTVWDQPYTVKGDPQVLPLAIPAEDKFLQAVQPRYQGRVDTPEHPIWRNVMTDQNAIERMAAEKAYPLNPEMLERYLIESRQMPAKEAIANARALVRGDRVPIEGGRQTLNEFINDYGGKPYNDADRQAMVDLARDAWEKEGHKGIRYINTAPMEAGAPGVKDPTSYIVFDPKNIRSQFAQFDPAKIGSSDLLAGIAGMAAVPFGIGALADQSRYEARQ